MCKVSVCCVVRERVHSGWRWMQVAMTMRDFSEAHKLDVESVLDLQL